ncbi:MAG: alpha/beta fold hydrolase [Chloroflexi bacterium]|nr:alpha/beta fold hydrolase [Chloroflexota bacterium]
MLAAQSSSISDILHELGSYPCPDSDFTCVELTVPLNHFNPNDTRSIQVVFGVLPATGERLGMFVTATGGPGTSGLSYADSYAGSFASEISDHYDLVFFDQRGGSQSGNLQCPSAATHFYRSDWQAITSQQEQQIVTTAQQFANECIAEIGIDPDTLGFYGTRQAIEDLELFRQAIGDDKLWLYGESYGTQFVQQYATSYPDHTATVILDGPVDLTLTGIEYYAEQIQAFNDVLTETLQACDSNERCKDNFQNGLALEFYNELEAELQVAPITVEFPLASGKTDTRQFTLSDLETVAASFIYSEDARMLLQRGLAAASTGDFTLMLRLLYNALGVDPETEAPLPGSSEGYSDALFYAVECSDYAYFEGTVEARTEAFLRAGDEIEGKVPHFGSLIYGDLPCVFWPGQPPEERPASFVGRGIPTFVLGATADPATPVANAERIFSRLDDGYLIVTQGGAHVIFGRGDACPDDLITDFLVDGIRPEERRIECEGIVSDPYLPTAPADVTELDSPLDALDALTTDLLYLPEYYYWDGKTLMMVACPQGGILSFAPSFNGDQFRFSACAFSRGFAITGSGSYDYDSGNLTVNVQIDGYKTGQVNYLLDSEGRSSISGEFDENPIEMANDPS